MAEALTLKETQKIEFELLLQFDALCNENHWRYSLGGGSLLGAIRHKGFIPWDDDVDVMMPRPDYELFLDYCQNHHTDFNLITYELVDGYNGLFAKIWDPKTIIKDNMMNLAFDVGVNIDVFPIDGLGSTEQEALKIFKKTSFKRELLNAVLWKKYFRSKTHSVFVEPIRLMLFIISRFVNPKKLLRKVDEENLRHSFDSSNYAGCVCGSYREREIMEKKVFEDYIEVPFEGYRAKSIKEYHAYLTKHYGNYMELPPKDKQETHHTNRAFLR